MWWGEWDDDPIHMAESGVTRIIINIKLVPCVCESNAIHIYVDIWLSCDQLPMMATTNLTQPQPRKNPEGGLF